MPEKYETIVGNEGGQLSIFVLEKGIYTWANRDSYKGSYKNDKKNGKGIYYWANEYDGEWKNN